MKRKISIGLILLFLAIFLIFGAVRRFERKLPETDSIIEICSFVEEYISYDSKRDTVKTTYVDVSGDLQHVTLFLLEMEEKKTSYVVKIDLGKHMITSVDEMGEGGLAAVPKRALEIQEWELDLSAAAKKADELMELVNALEWRRAYITTESYSEIGYCWTILYENEDNKISVAVNPFSGESWISDASDAGDSSVALTRT